MKNKKNIFIIIGIFIIVFLIAVSTKLYINNKPCSYSWVKEKNSVLEQYYLYVDDSLGNHIDGKIDITYLNGKTETKNISKKGLLIVKGVVKKVSNPKRR